MLRSLWCWILCCRATGEAEAGVGFAFDNGELAIDSLRHEVLSAGALQRNK